MSIGPDYKSYSIDELLEAHETIDRKAFPLQFKVLNDEITSRSIALTKSGVEREQKGETVDVYVPNEVPIWEQLKNILLSIGVIVFGKFFKGKKLTNISPNLDLQCTCIHNET